MEYTTSAGHGVSKINGGETFYAPPYRLRLICARCKRSHPSLSQVLECWETDKWMDRGTQTIKARKGWEMVTYRVKLDKLAETIGEAASSMVTTDHVIGFAIAERLEALVDALSHVAKNTSKIS